MKNKHVGVFISPQIIMYIYKDRFNCEITYKEVFKHVYIFFQLGKSRDRDIYLSGSKTTADKM